MKIKVLRWLGLATDEKRQEQRGVYEVFKMLSA